MINRVIQVLEKVVLNPGHPITNSDLEGLPRRVAAALLSRNSRQLASALAVGDANEACAHCVVVVVTTTTTSNSRDDH